MTQAQNVAIESSQINSSGVLLTTGGGTGLSTVGTNGQVLTSNGTTLSWVTPTAQTYPAAGIANSTGSAWTTSYTTTGSGTVLALATSPTITTPVIDKINTSVSGVSLGAGNASIMKNRIINGAMVISQRNGTSSVTPANGDYVIDRFKYEASQASKFTAQQLSASPPVGFNNYLGFTVASAVSIGASDYFNFVQPIEGFNAADLGWGTANAKTVTLSFQVYSSLTGTFGGALQNNANNRSYPFSYSIPVANTWTTISVTIAGDTTGTWLTTNGTAIRVQFGLGVGSTFSGTAGSWAASNYISATGATSVVGTSGATFYITGVQLEVGSSATGFEYRQYTTELQLCQRYLPAWTTNVNGTSNPSGAYIMRGTVDGSTVYIMETYPVQPRAIPTGYVSTLAVTSYGVNYPGTANPTVTAITFQSGGTSLTLFRLLVNVSSSTTTGTNAYLNAGTNAATIYATGCEL